MDFQIIDKPDAGNRLKYAPVINALKQLPEGKALSIPINGEKVQTLRAAVYRHAVQNGLDVASVVDREANALIVWKE